MHDLLSFLLGLCLALIMITLATYGTGPDSHA